MGEDGVHIGLTNIYYSVDGEEPKQLNGIKELAVGVDIANENDHYVEFPIGGSVSITHSLTKEEIKRFKKVLGLNKITKKRARKLFMSVGMDKNMAEDMIKIMRFIGMSRCENEVRYLMRRYKEFKKKGNKK